MGKATHEADEAALLIELEAVVRARRAIEERERELVRHLRERARPTAWARIGAVYGQTGEGVRKRFMALKARRSTE